MPKKYVKLNKNTTKSENNMVRIIDCPLCNGGKLRLDISSDFEVITDGYMHKLPLRKRCNNCNRDVKYIVAHKNDYEKTLKFVQTK